MGIEIIIIYAHITTEIGIVGRVDDTKKIRPEGKHTKEKNTNDPSCEPADESASFLISGCPYGSEQAPDPHY